MSGVPWKPLVSEGAPSRVDNPPPADVTVFVEAPQAASTTTVVFNLCNTILGSGTLCLPFTAASAGLVVHGLVVVGIMLVTWFSVGLLLRASDLAGPAAPKNYEGLGFYTTGRLGRSIAEFTFIFGGFGTVVSYFVFCTSLFTSVVHVPKEYHWLVTVGLAVFVVMPLSLVRRIKNLGWVSLLAVASVVFLVGFVLVTSAAVDHTPSSGGARAVDLSHNTVYTFTLLIGAFCCHNTALPNYEELRGRSAKKMNRAVGIALAICFVLYETIAVAGYLLFGRDTHDNVLLDFDDDFLRNHRATATPFRMSVVSMIVCLLLSAPVALWPFRSCVLSVYLRLVSGRHSASSDATRLQHNTVTLVSISLIVACAILTPNVRTPLSIVGSVSGSLIVFILPSWFLLSQTGVWWQWKNAGALLMLGAGLLLAPACLSLTLYSIIHGGSE